MSKRSAIENIENLEEDKELKKKKSSCEKDEPVIKNLIDLFEASDGALELPATTNDIKKLEEKLGVSMPTSYKQFLQLANGGHLKNKYFRLEDGSYAIITYISGIIDEPNTVLFSKEICEDLDVGTGYAILSGVGPEYFALDFTENEKEPTVISILKEDGGVKITKLAENFEIFMSCLEYHEEDCYVVALKCVTPVGELEATVIEKLKEVNIEIKTEEEIKQMNQFGIEFIGGEDEDELDEEWENHREEDDEPRELGARTNEVKDLGGPSSSSSESVDEEKSESGEEERNSGDEEDDDSQSRDEFLFGSDDDSVVNKQCSVSELKPNEYPNESFQGYNVIFAYSMLKEGPYEEDLQKIHKVLESVVGADSIHVISEPIDGALVKHIFG